MLIYCQIALRNKFQWNFDKNINIFFEFFLKILAIVFVPQYEAYVAIGYRWVGVGGFSEVVATFSTVGGSFE